MLHHLFLTRGKNNIIWRFNYFFRARFFKAVNELQLVGMFTEFGSSRKKRRQIERLNIHDSLELY